MQYQLSNHGESVRLEPHVFDLLQYLIEHRDRVVPRQELLDSLWKGKVVTDGVLSARLKDARKAVSDTGAAQSIIKTLYGRGYQFVAPVEENPENNDPLNDTRESDVSEQSYLAGNPSLAVLPFINLSGEPAQEVIVDGMTDEMIAGLSRIPKLLVVSYHSTMTYKGRTLDIKEVGREQGVHYVLEGSLRKMDNEIRVTAQLINAITGHHLWADRYQGSMDDFFDFQDKIIHNVIIELQIKLVEGERARPWGSGTDNIAAWELVSRAKFLVEIPCTGTGPGRARISPPGNRTR